MGLAIAWLCATGCQPPAGIRCNDGLSLPPCWGRLNFGFISVAAAGARIWNEKSRPLSRDLFADVSKIDRRLSQSPS
jgi:hypothetical protein